MGVLSEITKNIVCIPEPENLERRLSIMWTDIKTPEGKLLCRINFQERLVECAKGIWIVTVNMDTKQVLKQRRA